MPLSILSPILIGKLSFGSAGLLESTTVGEDRAEPCASTCEEGMVVLVSCRAGGCVSTKRLFAKNTPATSTKATITAADKRGDRCHQAKGLPIVSVLDLVRRRVVCGCPSIPRAASRSR